MSHMVSVEMCVFVLSTVGKQILKKDQPTHIVQRRGSILSAGVNFPLVTLI